jgi:polysaccharide biosynthesis transport protein
VTQKSETPQLALTDAHPPARNLLLIFWRRKALIAAGTAVGLVMAVLAYSQYTPIYQSSAQVLVVKKSNGAMQVQGGDSRVTVIEDYVATQLILIKSPFIIERAVKKRDLQNLRSFQGGGDPVEIIRSGLGAEREKDGSGSQNNIINLSYKGTVAEDCPAVLKAIIGSYQDFLDEKYKSTSNDTVDLISSGRDTLMKDLAAKEKAYREFRQKSPLIWKGKDGVNVQQERVAEIEAKRSGLMIRRAEAQERLKIIEEAVKEKLPRGNLLALAAPPAVAEDGKSPPTGPRALEEQLVVLQLQEQTLLEDYGEDHPLVHSLRKRIGMLRGYLNPASAPADKMVLGAGDAGAEAPDPVERYVQGLKRELVTTETLLQSLSELLEQEQKAARALNSLQIEDENYQADIARTQQMCDGIIKRLTEINMSREAGGFDAAAISKPAIGGKVAPNFLYFLVSGLLLGTLSGAGFGYLAELSDKGFRTSDEIRRGLGLPVIGHIPLLIPDATAMANTDAGLTGLDPFLCTHYRSRSVDAEAYRAVRTALYFSTQGGGHNLIQVTSPDMGDGKSTLITNLAVSIAQSGKRIVLVDADLRRPRLHKMLGLPANLTGLAAVISGTVELREAVQQTAIPGLFVLPCGPLPPNPAELLTSPCFKAVLEDLRAQYDFVLVDTPPLLVVTDPCVVAPRVDGVVLAMRMSKKSRPKAERAKEILATLGVKVLGVVVNGVTPNKNSGSYGAGQYEYTYGPDDYSSTEEEKPGNYYDHAEAAAEAPAATEPIPVERAKRSPQGLWRLPLLTWVLTWWA